MNNDPIKPKTKSNTFVDGQTDVQMKRQQVQTNPQKERQVRPLL